MAVEGEAHVALGVTDDGALIRIDGQVAQRRFDHPRFRFAAAAVDLQFCHLTRLSAIRVMRAVIDGIEIRTVLSEFLLQPRVNLFESGRSALTAR